MYVFVCIFVVLICHGSLIWFQSFWYREIVCSYIDKILFLISMLFLGIEFRKTYGFGTFVLDSPCQFSLTDPAQMCSYHFIMLIPVYTSLFCTSRKVFYGCFGAFWLKSTLSWPNLVHDFRGCDRYSNGQNSCLVLLQGIDHRFYHVDLFLCKSIWFSWFVLTTSVYLPQIKKSIKIRRIVSFEWKLCFFHLLVQ